MQSSRIFFKLVILNWESEKAAVLRCVDDLTTKFSCTWHLTMLEEDISTLTKSKNVTTCLQCKSALILLGMIYLWYTCAQNLLSIRFVSWCHYSAVHSSETVLEDVSMTSIPTSCSCSLQFLYIWASVKYCMYLHVLLYCLYICTSLFHEPR